jgi:hypothetical protein
MKIMSQKMWHYFIFQIVSILLLATNIYGEERKTLEGKL